MANDLNMHIAMGRLGQDPEFRTTSGGKTVANFSIACNRSWKAKGSDDWQQETSWFNVVVWGDARCRYIQNNVHKGDLVYVVGAGQVRAWDSEQGRKWFYEIVVNPFDGKIEKVPAQQASHGRTDRSSIDSGYQSAANLGNAAIDKLSSHPPEFDDDIPF